MISSPIPSNRSIATKLALSASVFTPMTAMRRQFSRNDFRCLRKRYSCRDKSPAQYFWICSCLWRKAALCSSVSVASITASFRSDTQRSVPASFTGRPAYLNSEQATYQENPAKSLLFGRYVAAYEKLRRVKSHLRE
jgi:hypothetical protein